MIDKSKNIGRVVELSGQRVKIFDGDDYITAVVKGRIKYGDRDVSPIAVGDYVEYSQGKGKIAAVETIQPRITVLSKPAVEKKELLQILVSNIDRLVIVTSIVNPLFKPGLVDRFLVMAFKEDIKPVVVLNKTDLQSPDSVRNYFDSWRSISCETIFTSALTGDGLDELKNVLEHGTSVIAGHSGVGKSSLLNRISPDLKLKTREVSRSSDRGVHTTSRVSLYRLFPNGWVADTPGLKVFGLAGVDRKSLRKYFPEFERCDSECRFNNCVHIDEPGCAVKKSIETEDGKIAGFRYESYLRIYAKL